ncbi:MAG: cupredoxin domain-containing protein [Nanoarchaeota archaeon]|nr:cupredoxin domain-containing protein [Nanoarchaeota archaeon]
MSNEENPEKGENNTEGQDIGPDSEEGIENEDSISNEEIEEINEDEKIDEENEDSPEADSYEEEIKPAGKENKYFFRFVAITVIVLFAIVLFKFSSVPADYSPGNRIAGDVTGNVATNVEGAGEVQVVKMYVKNSEYILEPNTFKAGSKVRIEADVSRIPGCAKSIVISAFGIRKSLTPSKNVIEFTPNKAGTFNIACSMNMYKGTFTVLENDGTKSNYVEKANTAASSCGGAGGGCGGCGG